MLIALDLYISTSSASATQMVVRAIVCVACLGPFIWGGGNLVDHALVARVASRGDR
ncbi:hypothetical protein [Methylobacterium sp. CM6246]